MSSMKKNIFMIFGLVFLMVLGCSLVISAEPQTDIAVVWTAESGENLEIFPTDRNFYLPPAVDITKIKFSYEGEISYSGENKSFYGTLKAGETLDITLAKTTDERGAECYRFALIFGGKTEHYTFYHDTKLGSVFVQTSIGLPSIDVNKETRDKKSEILILDDQGKTEYSDSAAQTKSEIKGRGNATFTYLKKPYQIKLDSKTDLFGMGKAKTWILLANYTDQSMLHNALGFHLGDVLDIPYNIDYRFVNLYIDGEYRGMYMLCEKVQIDGNRIDIEDLEKATEKANPDIDLEDSRIVTVKSGKLINETILTKYTYCEGVKSPADITGGYLVELDFRGEQEPCHFTTESGLIYAVKSPEYASKEEMEYISGLFADMEEAIFSETGYNRKGIHYSEYIDMESFAGVYTVQELMKNWDAYLGSMFFFKDADQDGKTSKIYNGPLWDLDNTLGNIKFDKYFFDDTSFLWAQEGVFQNYVRDFGKKLMSHADFQYEVAQKYAVAYSAVKSVLSENGWFSESVDEICEGVAMDRTRWKLYDGHSWLLTQSGNKSSVKFIQFAEYGTPYDNTKDTALGFMRYYLSARAEALRSSIGTAETPPPPPPPEETTGSSSEQMTTESKQETSASTVDSSESTDSVSEPSAQGISPVALIIISAIFFVICGVALILIFIKKHGR